MLNLMELKLLLRRLNNMKKDIFLEKSSKFISITSKLISRLRFSDPNQIVSYLDINISYIKLGQEIRKKLNESEQITDEMFMYYWNNKEIIKEFNKNEEKRIMCNYNYKSRKALYQDMDFLSIEILNNKLLITPLYQDGLASYTSVKGKDGFAVKFEYPLTITDEELGKATMDAFEYCTSIYSFIRKNNSK